ncbi:MAG TPA: copper amine oxidase N-terminal domain-containing protein [Clostridia bacterium]|jgi:hypothetical protein|nr:copper amine oxidase N-terminal domain-containing protein [Clostridia bacterium]
MLKKCGVIFLIILILISILTPVAYAEKNSIKVNLNDKFLKFSVSPIIREGNLLIPVRDVAEEINAKLEWDGINQVVTIIRNYTIIKLQVKNSIGYVNGKMVFLQVPPTIVDNRVLVPIMFFSENMGLKINLDNENNIVYLKDTGVNY